jgi:alpha-L-rhamnosidase
VNDPFGDWLSPNEGQKRVNLKKNEAVSKEGTILYGTAYYYSFARRLADIARVLGRSADADTYTQLAGNIQEAFDRKFYDPEAGCYRGNERAITEYRMSANVIPLSFDLVPASKRQQIINGVLADIEKRGFRLNTGTAGTKALVDLLPRIAPADTTYKVIAQTNMPGWGYMVLNGAETIWESWSNKKGGSHNHPNLGLVGSYFYRNLAGIQPDPACPGFKHVILDPDIPSELKYVRGTFKSRFGLIASEWKKEKGKLLWNVTVPPNSTATIHIPAFSAESVTEGGKPLAKAEGVKFTKMKNGRAVCELQPGAYRFDSIIKQEEK